MSEEKLIEYRNKLDTDEDLQGKRKLLVELSILMLAINFTGAVFKEANTFIFKIEFTNQSGLSYFFLLAILFLLIRYFAYAHHYHPSKMAEPSVMGFRGADYMHTVVEDSGHNDLGFRASSVKDDMAALAKFFVPRFYVVCIAAYF